MHMTDISQAKQWQKDRDGGLTKKENVCGTKEGCTVCTPRATPQQVQSVYTGRYKATFENYLTFVLIDIYIKRQQFTDGDLSCCAVYTSSVDSISDYYNEFYSILSRYDPTRPV